MKRYKTREGIILTEVCGEHLLVAAHALRELCPCVTILNESSAFLWERLRAAASAEELALAVTNEYEVEDAVQVRSLIDAFLKQMIELNYLIPEEESNEKS